VEAGGAKLVGTDHRQIIHEASRLINDPGHYQRMAQIPNPYGDGTASDKIVEAL